MARKILTQERLKELLNYDPATGIFTNRVVRQGMRKGANSIAGTKNGYGYMVIQIDGRKFSAHRLAWLYMYGVWPVNQIDHINRVRDDNRIVNLRDVTPSENLHNGSDCPRNTSGVRNVVWHKRNKKWQAQIMVNNKYQYLGLYDDIEKARKVAELASKTLHPARVV
jgi:hypothetical protein